MLHRGHSNSKVYTGKGIEQIVFTLNGLVIKVEP